MELQPARRARAGRCSRDSASFVGGCSLETAEAVCGRAASASSSARSLDGVASLVDNGLVRQREGVDGEPRFRMLETIREYALERLAERGELDDTRTGAPRPLRRARRDRRARADPREPGARGSSGSTRRTTTSARRSPGRSSPDEVELGAAARGRARPLLEHPRPDDRGPPLAREALAPPPASPPAVLGKAHFAAGLAALGQGDYPRGEAAAFEQSLELARRPATRPLEAPALAADRLARDDAAVRGDGEGEARTLAGQALELAREIGDKLVQSGALNILAELARRGGRRGRPRTSCTSRASRCAASSATSG